MLRPEAEAGAWEGEGLGGVVVVIDVPFGINFNKEGGMRTLSIT